MTCTDLQCRWSDCAPDTHNEMHLMLANLTATQARCTELLEEVRRLKHGPKHCPNCVGM